MKGTTILSVRDERSVIIVGDGQVSLGNTVMKSNAKKVRRTSDGRVIVGFAGSTADAFTLFDKFESKLEEFQGNLKRAAVELAKDWRSSKVLRNLEAMLCAADAGVSLIISGNGDVIEPEDGIMAIGSGGQFALAAARGLKAGGEKTARRIATQAMQIAADICVYTNNHFTIEEIVHADH